MFFGKICGNSIPPISDKIELTRELRELLFSSPSVLNELRQVALREDEYFNAFETEIESNRYKRSSETDRETAFAVASSVVRYFHRQDEKSFSLGGAAGADFPSDNKREKKFSIVKIL